MRRVTVSVGVAVLAALMAIDTLGAQPAAPPRSGPLPSIEDRTTGLRKIDGYFPLYWDERAGAMLLEMPAARHRVPAVDGPVGRPGLERPRSRSRPGRPGPHREVPARRSARAAGAAEPVVPLEQRQSARAALGRRLVRQVGAVGLRHRGRVERPACSSTPPTSSCATCTAPPAACVPAPSASTATAVRSTCPTPRASRRTPKWT